MSVTGTSGPVRYHCLVADAPRPDDIAAFLGRRVIGQEEAVREMSIALFKRLSGLQVNNVLMIGSSGTGKTTLMRAAEEFLASRPEFAGRSTLVRIHANVLADEIEGNRAGVAVLLRLLDRARDVEKDASVERLIEHAQQGIVFVDEVDKIRASVGGRPNVEGIRAQEALLTLLENEAVPVRMPDWAGGGTRAMDSSGILFVCAGAFEGLYDAVYDRVTVGEDRGSLQAVTVMDGGKVSQQLRFELREWLRNEDLFDYGMTPQFLSRFDAVVLLDKLGEEELVRIFLDTQEAGLEQARQFFRAHDLELAVSPAAVRRIAVEAARQQRLGARALKEVMRRVLRSYEYDPVSHASNGTVVIDLPEVEAVLGP